MNIKSIDEQIAIKEKEYQKYFEIKEVLEKTFFNLALFHIILAGIIAIYIILGPMIGYQISNIVITSIIAVITSCITSLGITGIKQTYAENKISKIVNEINSLTKTKKEYLISKAKQNQRVQEQNKSLQTIVDNRYYEKTSMKQNKENVLSLKLRKK